MGKNIKRRLFFFIALLASHIFAPTVLHAGAEDYRKAAEQGDTTAQLQLGICYALGDGIEKNSAESIRWFRKAADQGDAKAQLALGCCYRDGVGVEKNVGEAIRWIRKAAEQGDVTAQKELAIRYKDGIGVEKNLVEAVRWYRKAAEQGDVAAQVCLGIRYSLGEGVEKDLAEAVRWYRKAAEQGDASGQILLGTCYRAGEGVDQDSTEAFRLFRKAADQGDAKAQLQLAFCYRGGIGVKKNFIEAFKWFSKSAEKGDATAQIQLGCCYGLGEGVEKNQAEAVRWYRKAAEQGDTVGQILFGICYRDGTGVEKNPAEAVRWFRKAAEKGDADAQLYLGNFYSDGEFVVQSDMQACVHYLIAGALGNSSAPNRVRLIRKHLTDTQYTTAQRMATKWIEDFQSGTQHDVSATPDAVTLSPVAQSSGTGFVITRDGYFITCAHVIANARRINVLIGDTNYPAKLIYADKQNDVALLKLEGSEFRPIPLSQAAPEMGDKAFTVGFPNPDIQGSRPKYTEGSISALSGLIDDIRMMQITVPVQGGNSGGALADASGNAIGLVIAQLSAVEVFKYTGTIPQNVNFALKISYAMPLIQSVPGLSSQLPQQNKSITNSATIKNVETATGRVLAYP